MVFHTIYHYSPSPYLSIDSVSGPGLRLCTSQRRVTVYTSLSPMLLLST